MHSQLQPISYGKQVIGGLVVRPDSRQVLEKAAEGHPIEVSSGGAYINLYHVFSRMVAHDRKRFGALQIIRRQIGQSRWRIYVVKNESEVPETELERGYDPKWGRYRRYADQLAAGETLELSTRPEAVKARRAWQLYVPRNKRQHLRSLVEPAARRGWYSVRIVERPKGMQRKSESSSALSRKQ